MRHRRKLNFITMHSLIQITSRIELRGIVPSNQIKVTFIIILPFSLVRFYFFLFHIEIEGKCGWIIGGGGGGSKGYVGPPLKLLGGGGDFPPPPLLRPMKHLNNKTMDTKHGQIQKEYLLKEVLVYKEKKN